MKKRMIFILLLVVVTLFCTGCWGASDIDRRAYVVAIGIDKGQTPGYYNFTLQFVKPVEVNQITASGGASNREQREEVSPEETSSAISNALTNVVFETTSFLKAREIACQTMSRDPEYKHVRAIIISKEVAEEGIGKIIGDMVLVREMDPNVFVAVSESRAEVFLNNVSPELESNPATFYTQAFQKGYLPYKPDTQLNTIFNGIVSDNSDFALPLVGISNSANSGDLVPDTQLNGELEQISVTAEDNFKFSKNKSNSMGMAIFRGNKLVATENGGDAILYQILKGQLKESYVELSGDGDGNRVVALNIEQKSAPRYSYKWGTTGIPEIEIVVKLRGEHLSVGNASAGEDEIKEIENRVSEIIAQDLTRFLYKTSREYEADILRFSAQYKKQFATLTQWRMQNFKECYKKTWFNVSVETNLIRMGKTTHDIEE